MEFVYCEFKDSDGYWYRAKMSINRAAACALALGKDFRYLDDNVVFNGKDKK